MRLFLSAILVLFSLNAQAGGPLACHGYLQDGTPFAFVGNWGFLFDRTEETSHPDGTLTWTVPFSANLHDVGVRLNPGPGSADMQKCDWHTNMGQSIFMDGTYNAIVSADKTTIDSATTAWTIPVRKVPYSPAEGPDWKTGHASMPGCAKGQVDEFVWTEAGPNTDSKRSNSIRVSWTDTEGAEHSERVSLECRMGN